MLKRKKKERLIWYKTALDPTLGRDYATKKK